MAGKASGDIDLNQIERSYLFTGEIDSRRARAVASLVERLIAPGFETFDVERFDGDSSSIDEILSASSVIPFASDRKVIIVDRVDRLSADDQSRLAAIVPRLGERSCLILLGGEDAKAKRRPAAKGDDGDGDDPKSGKGLRSDLSSAVKKHGALVHYDKLKAQDLSTLAVGLLKAAGRKIDAQALQALVRAVESSPASLEREVEKLTMYTDGRDTVTINDVEKLIPRPAEDRVFPLIDAVAAGRAEAAIELLNETFAASSKPDNEVLKVVALLARHFRLLYQTKYLTAEAGVRSLASVPDEVRSLLTQEHSPLSVSEWQRGKLMDQARHFSLLELRHCLRLILECELTAKGHGTTGGTPRLGLDMLVLRISQRKSIPLGSA